MTSKMLDNPNKAMYASMREFLTFEMPEIIEEATQENLENLRHNLSSNISLESLRNKSRLNNVSRNITPHIMSGKESPHLTHRSHSA